MSELWVTNVYNQQGDGAPNFPNGATVTGVITATSFSGSGANLTGIDATALKDGSGNVKIQANSTGAVVTGVLTVSSSVSVGGTLTYEDVTNIDSVGLITARDGIHVTGNIGLGGATYGTAGQVLTSGGSGANATWTSISAAPEITSNAATNINAGTAVVVNSSGQFAGVSSSTIAKNPGTWIGMEAGATSDSNGVELMIGSSTSWRQLAYDPDNGITMVMYKQNSNNATALWALKLNNNNTFDKSGSGAELSNANYGDSNICYAGQGRFVAFYVGTSGNAGRCRIITVNASTLAITVGSEINLGMPTGGLNTTTGVRCIWHPPTNKIVFVFREGGDVRYMASTGTMNYSSNTIDTWGPDKYVIFGDSSEGQISSTFSKCLTYDPDTEKVIFASFYNGSSASYSAVAMTINASTGGISMGTRKVINTDGNIPAGNYSIDYDELRNMVLFQWRYGSYYYIRTGTVASNGTITLNTRATLASNAGTVYNTMSSGKNGIFGWMWKDTSSSNNMGLKTGTIAANGDITVSSTIAYITYASGELEPRASIYDTQQQKIIVIFYEGSGDTKVASAAISSVDSTSTAYVGIANTTVTTGQSLAVRTFGGTSTYHTGLSTGSTYYVQSNGSFSTTADTPSVVGGVALNGTTLLVKS